MARLITLLEQHLDRPPSTVVTQATTWWETELALVKPQEIGLGVHLPVKVCYSHSFHTYVHIHKKHNHVFRLCILSRHDILSTHESNAMINSTGWTLGRIQATETCRPG